MVKLIITAADHNVDLESDDLTEDTDSVYVKEFDTAEEANLYIEGFTDGAGWLGEPVWRFIV